MIASAVGPPTQRRTRARLGATAPSPLGLWPPRDLGGTARVAPGRRAAERAAGRATCGEAVGSRRRIPARRGRRTALGGQASILVVMAAYVGLDVVGQGVDVDGQRDAVWKQQMRAADDGDVCQGIGRVRGRSGRVRHELQGLSSVLLLIDFVQAVECNYSCSLLGAAQTRSCSSDCSSDCARDCRFRPCCLKLPDNKPRRTFLPIRNCCSPPRRSRPASDPMP
jgi:hypothetical protein